MFYKNILKDIVKPLYYYLKNKNLREFYRLCDKWGHYQRYKGVDEIKFLNYQFYIPDVPSFIWQFKELFVDHAYSFKTKNKNVVIYDCGANIGMSALYFRALYPNAKIKAFEADSNIATVCNKNLVKNNINNVEIISSAVWIDNKGVSFSLEGADGGNLKENKNLSKVSSIRLKDYLSQEKSISMLKIDIEGAEYEVLKDCQDSLSNVEHLFVEYHSWNSDNQKLSEILEIFEKNNFRYYIETTGGRKKPFINKAVEQNMDLQLNIFGIRR